MFFCHCIQFSCNISLLLLFFFSLFLKPFPLSLLLLLSLHFFLKLFFLLLNLSSLLTFPRTCIRLGIIVASFHPRRSCRTTVIALFIFHPTRRTRVLGTILIILHPSRLVVSCICLVWRIFGPSRRICCIIFGPRRLITSLCSILIIFCPRRLIVCLYRFCLDCTFVSPGWLLGRIVIIFSPTRRVSFLH